MSAFSAKASCPLCRVPVSGPTCPVCRTSVSAWSGGRLAAAAVREARTTRSSSPANRPEPVGVTAQSFNLQVEGTVIKELPPAEWRRREPWAVVSGLLLFVCALPLIAAVGLVVMAVLIVLALFGARFFGLGMLGSVFALPLMMFRGNQRQPRMARQFIVRTTIGNRRVAQIGEWNAYLYEGCRVSLRGRERQGLFIVEAGEDLDNQSATLVRHDNRIPWATVAAILAVIAVIEYSSLLSGTGL